MESKDWSCSACTYLNDPRLKQCDVCGTPRPHPHLSAHNNNSNNNQPPRRAPPPLPADTPPQPAIAVYENVPQPYENVVQPSIATYENVPQQLQEPMARMDAFGHSQATTPTMQIACPVCDKSYPQVEIQGHVELCLVSMEAPAAPDHVQQTTQSFLRRQSIKTKDDTTNCVFISPVDCASFQSLDLHRTFRSELPTSVISSPNPNRYADILPSNKSRVRLNCFECPHCGHRYSSAVFDSHIVKCQQARGPIPSEPEQELARYVNANYIQGYANKNVRDYIAAQGPTNATVPAFIQMIWDMKVVCVVMCTDLKELGKTKCSKYWGEPGAPLRFGSTEVTGMICRAPNGEERPYEVRMITIKRDDGAEHTFAHYWFKSWPDHGVPVDADCGISPDEAINMMKDVRKYRGSRDSKASPLLVHCSAGCGRTGTMICIDMLITATRLRHPIDIVKMIEGMRRNRMCMVQHVDQYSFVYQAAIDLATAEVGPKNVITSNPTDAMTDIGWSRDPTDNQTNAGDPQVFVLKENAPRLVATIGNSSTTRSPTSAAKTFGHLESTAMARAPKLWFKPSWDKEKAKAFLSDKPIGWFVVRQSTRVAGVHVISVQERQFPNSPSNVVHIMLLQTEKSDGTNHFQLGELGDTTFPTIDSLVDHFSRNPYDEIVETGFELYLVHPPPNTRP